MNKIPLSSYFNCLQFVRSRVAAATKSLFVFLLAATAMAVYASEIEDLQKQLTTIEAEYKSGDITVSRLNEALKQLAILKGKVEANTEQQQSSVNELKKQLESLGEGAGAEPKMVQEKRAALKQQLQDNETLLAKYKVLSIAVDERHKDFQERSQTLFKERLLSRGPTIVELVPRALAADALMTEVLSVFILQRHGLDQLSLNDYVALLVWLLLAGVVAYWVRKRLKQWSSARRWGDAPFDVFAQGLVVTVMRYLPRIILSAVLAIFLLQLGITIASASFLQIVFVLLPLYFLARLVVEMVLFPRPPARRVLQLNDDVARHLARWFRVFITLAFLGAIGFWTILAAQPPELTIMLARDTFVVFCVPLAITLLLISSKVKRLERLRLLRIALVFLLLVTLVFELLGFRNFSYFVLRALFSMTLLYGSLRAIQWISSQLASVLENESYAVSRALKRALGLKSGQRIPGLIAFNFFIHTSLWVVFLFVAIRALDFSEDVIVTIQNWFIHGFELGNLTINPVRILFAIVLFSLVYIASGTQKTTKVSRASNIVSSGG